MPAVVIFLIAIFIWVCRIYAQIELQDFDRKELVTQQKLMNELLKQVRDNTWKGKL